VVAAGAALALAAGAVANSGAQGGNYARPGHTSKTDRAQATADGSKLLARLNLPTGATGASSEPAGGGSALAHPASTPGTPNLVDQHRWWVVAAKPDQALAYVEAHPPAGSKKVGWGSGGGPGGPTVSSVTYGWPATAGVLGTRQLVVELVRLGHGRTGVRADAQDVWITPRPDSERVPARVNRLTVTLVRGGKVAQGPYTLTSHAKIHAAAAVINSLPLFPPGAYSCPADFGVTVRMQFYSGARVKPAAVAGLDVFGCQTVALTVGGRGYPALAGWAAFGPTRSATQRVERALGLHLDTQPPF
jgi:hypothetical protein